MAQDTEVKKEQAPAEQEKPAAPAKKTMVRSRVTIDFPSLGWGITADTQRELPDDPEAQATILANDNITKVK